MPPAQFPASGILQGVREYGDHGPGLKRHPTERGANPWNAGGAALMALILWECNDCIPGCKLTAHIDLDDPPEGCPWAHQNTEDPNRCNWKAKKVLDD